MATVSYFLSAIFRKVRIVSGIVTILSKKPQQRH